jgi:A/G-specific adenine glycosylase
MTLKHENVTTTLPTPKSRARFKATIRAFYRDNKRSFPWRETTNPYHILVSEIMLQQTQTERVVSFYNRFIRELPTFDALARCSTDHLITLWKGLGYNRRALALRATAQQVVDSYNGILPQSLEALTSLPGIGDYTAHAVTAFAYNKRALLIETNIRTVLIHHFFKECSEVSDQTLKIVLTQLLPRTNYREWYYALMDYGVHLKAQGIKAHRQSAHYTKQKPFRGSRRELRGKILGMLLNEQTKTMRIDKIVLATGKSTTEVTAVVESLVQEGFMTKKRGGAYMMRA